MADWSEQDVKQIQNWNEADHPRGQPKNAGQFVEKGGAKVIQSDALPNVARLIQQYKSKRGTFDNQVAISSMDKSEWKRYYDVLGEIQAGLLKERKSKKGKRWVILNVNELGTGKRTPARLIVDNGSYEHPRVQTVLTFDTDDDLYDFINV